MDPSGLIEMDDILRTDDDFTVGAGANANALPTQRRRAQVFMVAVREELFQRMLWKQLSLMVKKGSKAIIVISWLFDGNAPIIRKTTRSFVL